ncbi:MAG: hypothetical protein WC782_10590 [Methylococcaceae bacterium]|jgi:hypothetical protein
MATNIIEATHHHHKYSHASNHEKKELTIFINTREFIFHHNKTLSYQELVDLAFPGDIPSPDKNLRDHLQQ